MVDCLLCLVWYVNLLLEQEWWCWDDGFLVFDLGNELIYLWVCLEGVCGVLCKVCDCFFGELGELFEVGFVGLCSDCLEWISLLLCEVLECDVCYDDEVSCLVCVVLV